MNGAPANDFGPLQQGNKDIPTLEQKIPAKRVRKQQVPKVPKTELDGLGTHDNLLKKRKRPQTYEDDSDFEIGEDGQLTN